MHAVVREASDALAIALHVGGDGPAAHRRVDDDSYPAGPSTSMAAMVGVPSDALNCRLSSPSSTTTSTDVTKAVAGPASAKMSRSSSTVSPSAVTEKTRCPAAPGGPPAARINGDSVGKAAPPARTRPRALGAIERVCIRPGNLDAAAPIERRAAYEVTVVAPPVGNGSLVVRPSWA